MLAHDVAKEYQRIAKAGISPMLLAQFAQAVATCYSGAVQSGRTNTLDFRLDDDSMVVITVEPGQAPAFEVVEKVHDDMGEIKMRTLEGQS